MNLPELLCIRAGRSYFEAHLASCKVIGMQNLKLMCGERGFVLLPKQPMWRPRGLSLDPMNVFQAQGPSTLDREAKLLPQSFLLDDHVSPSRLCDQETSQSRTREGE